MPTTQQGWLTTHSPYYTKQIYLLTKEKRKTLQNSNASSSTSFGIIPLSLISFKAFAVESSMLSRYCKRESFSGAGSFFKYTRNRSASSSGTSHDKGVDGTALSHANTSLSDETYIEKNKGKLNSMQTVSFLFFVPVK